MPPREYKPPTAAPTIREGVAHSPKLKAELRGCTEAICGIVDTVEKVTSKWYRLSVNIGPDVEKTGYLNIMSTMGGSCVLGQRVAIAIVGSFVGDQRVEATERGGFFSQGNLVDGVMLGWSEKDANANVAVALPSHFLPGDAVPDSKPPNKLESEASKDKFGNKIVEEAEDNHYGKALTKDEKKAKAASKKLERDSKKKADKGIEDDVADIDGKPQATKSELKKIKKIVADKRKKNPKEEVFTDDELEAAGFAIEGEGEE